MVRKRHIHEYYNTHTHTHVLSWFEYRTHASIVCSHLTDTNIKRNPCVTMVIRNSVCTTVLDTNRVVDWMKERESPWWKTDTFRYKNIFNSRYILSAFICFLNVSLFAVFILFIFVISIGFVAILRLLLPRCSALLCSMFLCVRI